ncbi:MAG: ATP-binding protein [Coriobacteriaceae bacterium]|uniref:ATP-binding protein n=1 Tax=Tractidigestivibacter sp. TaxID=2847320 RepID=UPI002A80BF3D|nr:ATP-binding protein [Tractidigestivibacter sp.]MCI6274407.1 ATP-binding protein [Coriobacteriaceae bacterium]MCI6844456.1 ATP-binding protein [Coriobacteriaceae bacterium]MDY4535465.1 ATP-binding protein [Tractidigestivibacter sp.]MDY5272150.1 ATP-binding protein [Tractidigestivibacter sp.]
MPTTISCPYCGQPLKPRYFQLFGERKQMGFEGCRCEGATSEREVIARREAEKERQRERREFMERVRRAGVMPRFENAEHPQAERCADDVINGRNLYIYGDVGTLKTHLASAMTRKLVERNVNVCFSAMWKILDAIKAGFHENYDPLPKYQHVQVLVLDDLGKESPTDFALERLFALVDERSARMLPTVVTTQYKPGLLIDRLAKNGDGDTAMAIVSRLRQDCRSIELDGGDRRRG